MIEGRNKIGESVTANDGSPYTLCCLKDTATTAFYLQVVRGDWQVAAPNVIALTSITGADWSVPTAALMGRKANELNQAIKVYFNVIPDTEPIDWFQAAEDGIGGLTLIIESGIPQIKQ